ncbi:DUF2852 domain-containing protein [Neptuniibacter caesariensis]|uniref:DUF2852 domain-containing protein n=1 Tax=Neptuniibacter caesariensis TaxID=207954 RepID=A0A7U8C3I9_NEPCE|nr:DUF2852 domain-containing protein [Neptuniibacter caesariensis]EAR60825.1 hypothetical protein MED92_16300 [Oceanospirillum sp. MED92] [Neptuniibacter caesariensis]
MATYEHSGTNKETHKAHRCGGGHWSAANIASMVLGFIIFAPLGFVILVWSILGNPVQELPGWIRAQWGRVVRGGKVKTVNGEENEVFNEYQQTQHDRISEIKEEIRKRAEAFRDFKANAQRRKDQQEFDDFMANKPENGA